MAELHGLDDGRCDVFLRAGRCEGARVEILFYFNDRCAGVGELCVCEEHLRDHLREHLLHQDPTEIG